MAVTHGGNMWQPITGPGSRGCSLGGAGPAGTAQLPLRGGSEESLHQPSQLQLRPGRIAKIKFLSGRSALLFLFLARGCSVKFCCRARSFSPLAPLVFGSGPGLWAYGQQQEAREGEPGMCHRKIGPLFGIRDVQI